MLRRVMRPTQKAYRHAWSLNPLKAADERQKPSKRDPRAAILELVYNGLSVVVDAALVRRPPAAAIHTVRTRPAGTREFLPFSPPLFVTTSHHQPQHASGTVTNPA
jgi:hypothetical protein